MNLKFWKSKHSLADHTVGFQQAVLLHLTRQETNERDHQLRMEELQEARDKRNAVYSERYDKDYSAHVKAINADSAKQVQLLTEIRDLLKARG